MSPVALCMHVCSSITTDISTLLLPEQPHTAAGVRADAYYSTVERRPLSSLCGHPRGHKLRDIYTLQILQRESRVAYLQR